MGEKSVKHPDYNWNGFYASGVKDNIVIVPFGTNIFSYTNVVEEQAKKHAKKRGLITRILEKAGKRLRSLRLKDSADRPYERSC